MNRFQINWARQHDWFIGSKNGLVLVQDWVKSSENGTFLSTVKSFTNFGELRAWAGY